MRSKSVVAALITAVLLSFIPVNANAGYSKPTPTPLKQIQPTPKQPSFKNPMSQKDFDNCMSSAAANRKCATGR
jgi:hypothetical protein